MKILTESMGPPSPSVPSQFHQWRETFMTTSQVMMGGARVPKPGRFPL